ncbi:MAG: alpha/beta hydrolase [Actinomycetota bacterium]|nr:alpha/beta hydrolase [Actinomycetota bacterium]
MQRGRIAGWALAVIAMLTLAYFGVGLFAAARFTAPSDGPMEGTPADVGLDFRTVELQSTDGIGLSAWWIPGANSSRAAVLVHGWGGNKSNEQVLATAPIYAGAGYNVLIPDLRAHGASGGDRRTLGYRETRDVRGALGWLQERGFEAEEVVLHGWSMGAATVVRSAPGTGVAAVVEECGYADLPLLLPEEIPDSSGLPAFFNPGIMLSAKLFLNLDPWAVVPQREAARLSQKETLLLIIHSTADDTVPFGHARMFREACPGAGFWRLEGYGHVEAYTHPEYRERLLNFLQGLEARETT